jgi:hypothetical protein
MEAFKEQLQKYRSEEKSDFRRMNLAYAFQDLVASFGVSDGMMVVESVNCILELQKEDPELIKTIGYDLLETSVKLHLLFGTKSDKILFEFSKNIAFYSSPKELLIQLNTLMVVIKENVNETGFEIFKDISSEGKSVFKTVITFYLSIILRKIEEKFLKTAFQELYLFVEMIQDDLETSQVLGLGIFLDLLEGLRERSFMIKVNAQKQVLKFLLDLVLVFEKCGKYLKNYEEVLKLLREIFGNFEFLLEVFWKGSFENPEKYSEVFLILSSKVVRLSHFEFPLIFSGCKKFQLLVVNSIKSAERSSSLFLEILENSIEGLEENLKISQIFTSFSFYRKPCEMIVDLLHCCALLPSNDEKLKAWTLFLKLMEKFENFEGFQLLCFLIQKVVWDQPRSFLIDWAGKRFFKGLFSVEDVVRVLNLALCFEVLEENNETLHAAIVLFKRIAFLQFDESIQLRVNRIRERLMEIKLKMTEEHSLSIFHLQELGI